jgi:thiol-disulfide isomerase/thioredoxin
MKRVLILLLLLACASSAVPQSGRRVNTTRTTPIAPVQPSANPAPEVSPPPKPRPSALMFLPEKVLERKIKAIDDGKTFRLADFQGKVMVINIWASWCGPCRREVPDYERVRKDYAGNDNVEFIGLTVDDSVDAPKVARFVRETGFGFRLGWAEEDMARVLMNNRGSIPQTLVIDRSGAVISHWDGYARGHNASRLKDAIENALK